jgi:hypothetical protein
VDDGSDRCVPRYDTAPSRPPGVLCIIHARSRQVSPRPTGPSQQRPRVWRARFATRRWGTTHTRSSSDPAWSVLNACHACQRSTRGTPHRLAPCLPGGERWISRTAKVVRKPPPGFPLFDRFCPCGEETTEKASPHRSYLRLASERNTA